MCSFELCRVGVMHVNNTVNTHKYTSPKVPHYIHRELTEKLKVELR